MQSPSHDISLLEFAEISTVTFAESVSPGVVLQLVLADSVLRTDLANVTSGHRLLFGVGFTDRSLFIFVVRSG